ncbi:FadR/GntR family transcriptional regulator [Actinorugispora endophytica]|uniref:DNA-binding FadR family transcriptional regulator n=1 Tax=Actinorugispora endophytica TaxID=1605990 RepID=A0A4R6UI66_9ACTN|nr:FCD domain-containing protein [Actinorugispora endophytica]TDQ45746.1 DNA-binding FadR family transcriptional regulator [Actinorugispora endophytica]
MSSESLVDSLAEHLLDQVVRGEIAVDEALPSEAELAVQAGVSRLTVREAVKVLRTKNIVRVKRGRGTYVNAADRWTDLEPVLRAVGRGAGAGTTALAVVEVRRMIEAGAAELCAARRTEADLALLAAHVAEMDEAAAAGDAAAFARADDAFHEAVLRSCGNAFVPAVCGPLDRLLPHVRTRAAAFAPVRENAQKHHRHILAEVTAGSPAAARGAMEAHMDQTATDLLHYVVDRMGEAPR